MKMREEKVENKVKPQRTTRAERKKAKFAKKANEHVQLCVAASEFHRAYLAIELGCEEEMLEQLKASLEDLQRESKTTVTVKKQRRIAPRKEVIEF